ncbi:SpoIIIAH-like family protein [Mesobacillus harenae]|uniref:SpoIIIAH-like family protein n=1 Tax=Mesobacillus harenae TaxID=2213203 RepID=UPI0015804F60|nr:SpoIIIAH-like family protein [Mesobacillus harenae]
MLLKKQTVWLLTMLSLVVVLSVYYITSPEQQNGNQLAGGTEEQQENTAENAEGQETATNETADGETVISEISSDEVFEALRMQLDDQRSMRKGELQAIIASTDLPAPERSKAYDEMKELNQIATKENTLEMLIKAMNYEDVLVRADGEKVRITIKSKEHSAKAANEIIQLVRTELGDMQPVAVEFQPGK